MPTDPVEKIRCQRCGAAWSASDGSWRFEGTLWAHQCSDLHPQVGHIGVGAVPRFFNVTVFRQDRVLGAHRGIGHGQDAAEQWSEDLWVQIEKAQADGDPVTAVFRDQCGEFWYHVEPNRRLRSRTTLETIEQPPEPGPEPE